MTRLYASAVCVLFAISALPLARSASWWSLITYNTVINSTSRTAPVNFHCSAENTNVTRILGSCHKDLCNSDFKLLSTIAIGILRALKECQKQFKDRQWNCSVFEEGPYLGRFVEEGTHETAFVDAIISAGIAREVARKCKDQSLSHCTCTSYTNNELAEIAASAQFSSAIFSSGCGDDCSYGVKMSEAFTDCDLVSNKSIISIVTMHNNKVGRKEVEESSVQCICHGICGSCTVQTCFKKVPDIEQVGSKLLEKYDNSVQVKSSSSSGKLVPVGGGPDLSDDMLGFVHLSPNLCKRDLSNGVYGTSGRQCYPDRNDHTGCISMCCGQQPMVREVETHDECCEFIWCCKFECRQCNRRSVIQYYCP